MDTEIFWKAVETSDARFNGAFVYAVSSTGIFCRPSCRSRAPKRENVRFFATPEAAAAGGYRACRRCRPLDARPDRRVETALAACRLIEAEGAASLDALSARLGLSAAHLQKTFKEIVGVSPKKYAEAKRLEKFKSEVRKGSDVTSALYEAGFGSSSRLYENAAAKLGMTPKTYAKKGKNMSIGYTVVDCRLGKLLVARTQQGVCAVTFGDDEETLRQALAAEYADAEIGRDDERLREYVAPILAHLEGRRRTLDLPLDVQATAFQTRVWEALRQIPYGATVSYREIADRIGRPSAARAVAAACAANRVALVIPCHRVVRAGGDLSGYRWGVERKRKILEKEGNNLGLRIEN